LRKSLFIALLAKRIVELRDLTPIFTFVALMVGCADKPSQPPAIVSVTRLVGTWQGRGTATVGDVPSETGRIRITWETINESPVGAGTFKLTLRSAISGRTIGVVADHRGTGNGTADYDEGPRTYDFLVESAHLDWKFTVEETTGEFQAGSGTWKR
jgi:hypothetical protein